MRLLTFKIDKYTFSIKAELVNEVITLPKFTRVWRAQEAVKGITNLRGEIIVIFDFAKVLGLKSEGGNNKQIIVVESADEKVAISIEMVDNVLQIEDRDIQPPPGNLSEEIAHFISGVIEINKNLVCILDVDALLADPKLLSAAV